MDYAEIRRLSLKAFLGFLGLTALIAILSVLAGEFGKVQWKILATTLTISAASICSMSCAAFIEKKKLVQLGLSGIFLSVSAAALLIVGMWPEIDSEAYWKTTATVGVLALAFAHAFLLIIPELDDRQKWVQSLSAVFIGVLVFQIVGVVWAEIDNEVYYRILAVVAIVVGLETLAIPILMKLRKGNGEKREKLFLEWVQGDIYRDTAGREYEVHKHNTECGASDAKEPDRFSSHPMN